MGHGNFTEDFRLDAVKHITDRGHSVADVSKRLDVSTHSLYGWMKRYAIAPTVAVKEDQSSWDNAQAAESDEDNEPEYDSEPLDYDDDPDMEY
jgi:transposase